MSANEDFARSTLNVISDRPCSSNDAVAVPFSTPGGFWKCASAGPLYVTSAANHSFTRHYLFMCLLTCGNGCSPHARAVQRLRNVYLLLLPDGHRMSTACDAAACDAPSVRATLSVATASRCAGRNVVVPRPGVYSVAAARTSDVHWTTGTDVWRLDTGRV